MNGNGSVLTVKNADRRFVPEAGNFGPLDMASDRLITQVLGIFSLLSFSTFDASWRRKA
jgi:hypothetical protein